jgi:hypothetical protein
MIEGKRGKSPMSIAEANERRKAKLAAVEEHVRLEDRHDLDGIVGTFGASARYDEEPWDDATVLQQLGVFHEPGGTIGRIETVIMHPLTVAQAVRERFCSGGNSHPSD